MTTDERIAELLREKLQAQVVDVENESWRHKGHAGALEGAHYRVRVVSVLFDGKSLVERHRMVYAALETEMKGIHALAIQAELPEARS